MIHVQSISPGTPEKFQELMNEFDADLLEPVET